MMRYAQTCPIIFGSGTVSLLGEEVKKLGCTKVLIVSGRHVPTTDGYKKCIDSLKTAGIVFVEFHKVLPDPPDYIVNEGGALARSEKVDGIVAIGGGSHIDAAKGINVLINNEGPVNNYFGNPFYNPGVPVITVPTTSGTGSESTSVGVITDTINNVKNSVVCNATLGIMDPEMTITAGPDLTVANGIDAFAHCAEAITTKQPNPKSELLASNAIQRIVKYLPVAFKDGNNLKAREELMLASNFAGIAFNDSLVHLGHAIAHSIGAKLHITHGIVCGLEIPEVMKYAANINAEKAEKVKIVGESMGITFSGNESESEIGEKVAAEIRKLLHSLGVKSFKEMKISRGDVLNARDLVFQDPCYNFVPKEVTSEELDAILGDMYDLYQ